MLCKPLLLNRCPAAPPLICSAHKRAPVCSSSPLFHFLFISSRHTHLVLGSVFFSILRWHMYYGTVYRTSINHLFSPQHLYLPSFCVSSILSLSRSRTLGKPPFQLVLITSLPCSSRSSHTIVFANLVNNYTCFSHLFCPFF